MSRTGMAPNCWGGLPDCGRSGPMGAMPDGWYSGPGPSVAGYCSGCVGRRLVTASEAPLLWWVVERILARFNRFLRQSKNCEARPDASDPWFDAAILHPKFKMLSARLHDFPQALSKARNKR